MTKPSVSFAGNLTDDPVVVWRDQAEHAAQSLIKGSRVVVVGQLQQRSWTAEDGRAHDLVEVVAEELGRATALGDGDHDRATTTGRR